MLFRAQYRRSISIAERGEDSSSSTDDKSDDLGKVSSVDKLNKQYQKLIGYKAETKTDKLLLKGIFKPDSPRRGKSDNNNDRKKLLLQSHSRNLNRIWR